jgi:tetratricopeptide (TPR) repeat protein
MAPKIDPNLPTDADLTKYLSDKSCLIVDSNAVSRQSILKFMVTSGVNKDKISTVDNFKEAEDAIKKNRPNIVFCEFKITKHLATELLPTHLEMNPNRLDASFFVIADSNSMAIAAEVAENDVEGLIVKPFTMNSLKSSLLNGIKEKINPTPYVQNLEKAKTVYRSKNFEEALAMLEQCKTMSKDPSNACYYEGNVHGEMTNLKMAKDSYYEGLSANPDHFRCLNELFKLSLNEKNYMEAFDHGTKIFKKYPVSPSRIPDLTRIIIASNQFEEIFELAQIFAKEENLDPHMVAYIAAGLAVTAKHYAKVGDEANTAKAVQKGISLSQGSVKILRNMAQSYLLINKPQEAEKLLKQVNEQEQSTEHYLGMDFEISAATLPAGEIIKRGYELVKKGIKDQIIYEILIQKMKEGAAKPEMIEEIQSLAVRTYPELKAKFV